MAKNIRTYIYCYDDHRVFSEEIRKRFDDASRYVLKFFQNREDLIRMLQAEKESRYCKIVIIGLLDSKENYDQDSKMIADVKNIDPGTGIILLCHADKINDVMIKMNVTIDSLIPQNSNSILRIHNAVKKIFSEHNIGIYKKRRNYSFAVLFVFVVLSFLMLFISYLKFPRFF